MYIGYCRVSTDDKGQTTANQEYTIKSKQEVSLFINDEGVSGTIHPMKRPGLSKLLTIAKRGDVVVITAYDRISRDTRHFLELIDQLKERGVTLISLREAIDTSSAVGYAMATAMMAFAKLERDNISERTKQALQRVKAEGKQLGKRKNEALHKRIHELYGQGMKKSHIAKELSVSRPTIDAALRNHSAS